MRIDYIIPYVNDAHLLAPDQAGSVRRCRSSSQLGTPPSFQVNPSQPLIPHKTSTQRRTP